MLRPILKGIPPVLAGIGAAWITSSLIIDVSAVDSMTFLAVPLFVAAAALLATSLPARLTTRVDPMPALGAE